MARVTDGGRRVLLRAAAVIALAAGCLGGAGCVPPAEPLPRALAGENIPPPAGPEGTAQSPAPSPVPEAWQESTLPGLDSSLAQLYTAFRAGDHARLAALGGNPHVDLAAGTARVILEMSRSPEAHPAGPPIVEVVTLENGQKVEIQHAPPIAIRADLAQAIAATGATYETAYENWVQVLAPFGSLPGLAQIPDVRLVRPPFPATAR